MSCKKKKKANELDFQMNFYARKDLHTKKTWELETKDARKHRYNHISEGN